jgi:hypothetical protein
LESFVLTDVVGISPYSCREKHPGLLSKSFNYRHTGFWRYGAAAFDVTCKFRFLKGLVVVFEPLFCGFAETLEGKLFLMTPWESARIALVMSEMR